MTAAVAATLVAGIGLVLLLTAQPLGRPRVGLPERLHRLRDAPPASIPAESVFTTPGLDPVLLPVLRPAGRAALRLAERAGADADRLSRQLALVGDRGGPAVHYGQALLLGLLGFLLPALLGGFGAAASWPPWTWLAGAALGLMTPELTLRVRVRRRRRELAGGVGAASEYLALAVSAGLGLEQALAETARAGSGVFFDRLRVELARARLHRRPGVDAIHTLARDLDLPELQALAGVLEASTQQGTPLAGTLRAQADTARQRRRLALLAAGQQAQVTMLLPVAGLILPALLLVVLYPVAANLLQLTTP